MNQPLLVFHGELDSHAAQVYVKWPGHSDGTMTLRGHVRGPFTARARTLPATFSLQDLGPGPSLLAQATIADPCFWTPGHPFQYEVVAEVCRGAEVIARAEQFLGLRHLGLLRGQLAWERQAWTLLGCQDVTTAAAPWSAWRDQQAVRMVDAPSETFCQEASQEGVVLAARIDLHTSTDPASEVRRLGKWPAVAVVIVAGEVRGDLPLREAAPNCLLAATWELGRTRQLPPWAQLAVVTIADGHELSANGGPPVPWIALQQHSTMDSIADNMAAARKWAEQQVPCGSCVGCIV